MKTISRVLCVIDPTVDSQPALARAAWFAKQCDASLEVLHCQYDEYLSAHQFFEKKRFKPAAALLSATLKQRLEELVVPIRATGVTCDTTVVWDHPLHEGIVRHATTSRSDIVFKDTHNHPTLGFSSLTNTDWSLMRECPLPLWFVKPHDMPIHRQYIAAIDPFNLSDEHANLDSEILTLGNYIASRTSGELHVLHAFDPRAARTSTDNYNDLSTEAIEDEARKLLSGRVDEIATSHRVSAENIHLVAGSAHTQLPLFAHSLNAALVIMGAISRSRLRRVFIGATAERTLDRLDCDLLIVKLPEAESSDAT
jgi:universal stress protein E